MPSRRKSREYALQMLYQADISGSSAQEVLDSFWLTRTTNRQTRAFAERLFSETSAHLEEVDALITAQAENWTLHRMSSVDRNVLRLGVSELMMNESPVPVIIDQALEVAKIFGGGDSSEFVNGILDAVRQALSANSSAC